MSKATDNRHKADHPLAATMAGASCLAIECRPSSIEFRLRTGYVDVQAKDLDDALAIIGKATKEELTGSTITVTSLGRLGGIVAKLYMEQQFTWRRHILGKGIEQCGLWRYYRYTIYSYSF